MYSPGYFKGKKITVMGLGLLGRGVGDSVFLAEEGAELIITDLKSKEELAESVKLLEKYPNVSFVLGEHRLEDFRNRDFILKAAGVPLNSPYIEEARKNNIPIEMSASLFAALSSATIVGITGTRGKTTVTHLVYEILKEAYKNIGTNIFLGGNIRGVATLPFLKEIKKGDIAVLELDSWQLQGFGERNISPHISIFTNLLDDHLNYYHGDKEKYFEDKAQIFLYQKEGDYLITGTAVQDLITKKYGNKLTVSPQGVSRDMIPSDWKITLKGSHNRENIALAISAAEKMGIDSEVVKKTVETFKGVPGRLEFIREYKGIKIYNDTTATTPDATLAALKALEKNTVLIMGGADKQLDMSGLMKEIPNYTKTVILLSGTGTDRIKDTNPTYSSLKEALQKALETAEAGDNILLSPAFASFGMFKNEYDRGDQFVQLVQDLKE